jgi:hypothetical protein
MVCKDYNYVDYPSDKLFFESFMKFEPGSNFGQDIELKIELISENVTLKLNYLQFNNDDYR